MKGHVLHRARAHLKVPGCSLVLNALLTKKLPMFLSRLNEINGSCEKILPVSSVELRYRAVVLIKKFVFNVAYEKIGVAGQSFRRLH